MTHQDILDAIKQYSLVAIAEPDLAATVSEYITEAEHQDGVDFWQNFASVLEMVADFEIWLENN